MRLLCVESFSSCIMGAGRIGRGWSLFRRWGGELFVMTVLNRDFYAVCWECESISYPTRSSRNTFLTSSIWYLEFLLATLGWKSIKVNKFKACCQRRTGLTPVVGSWAVIPGPRYPWARCNDIPNAQSSCPGQLAHSESSLLKSVYVLLVCSCKLLISVISPLRVRVIFCLAPCFSLLCVLTCPLACPSLCLAVWIWDTNCSSLRNIPPTQRDEINFFLYLFLQTQEGVGGRWRMVDSCR